MIPQTTATRLINKISNRLVMNGDVPNPKLAQEIARRWANLR